jgi:hypothetical protein
LYKNFHNGRIAPVPAEVIGKSVQLANESKTL